MQEEDSKQQAGAQAPAPPESGAGAEQAPDADPVAEARRQLAEAQDRHLRLLAETENFKKRLAREREEERLYAAQELAGSLLPVVDNLERALGAAKAAGGQAAEGPLLKLEQGVELVLKQFYDALARQGVLPVEAALGRAFDPHLHQPLVQEPTDKAEEGTVLEILQKGWRMGERLLRPCLVKVAAKP